MWTISRANVIAYVWLRTCRFLSRPTVSGRGYSPMNPSLFPNVGHSTDLKDILLSPQGRAGTRIQLISGYYTQVVCYFCRHNDFQVLSQKMAGESGVSMCVKGFDLFQCSSYNTNAPNFIQQICWLLSWHIWYCARILKSTVHNWYTIIFHCGFAITIVAS